MAANGSLLGDGVFISGGSAAAFDTSDAVSTAFAPGQLGKIANIREITGPDPGSAPKVLQYVSRYATDTVAVVNGCPAFWQDLDAFVVTGEHASAIGGSTNPLVAGVFGSSNPAAGSYGFIQVAGLATGVFGGSTAINTTNAPAGKRVVWNTGTNMTVAMAGTDATTLLAANTAFLRPGVGYYLATTGDNSTGATLSTTILVDTVHNSW